MWSHSWMKRPQCALRNSSTTIRVASVVSNVKTLIEQPGDNDRAGKQHAITRLKPVWSIWRAMSGFNSPTARRSKRAAALFHRKENWANVSNGVYLKSGNGWVRGDRVAPSWNPNPFGQDIEIDGNVTAESRESGIPQIVGIFEPAGSMSQYRARRRRRACVYAGQRPDREDFDDGKPGSHGR